MLLKILVALLLLARFSKYEAGAYSLFVPKTRPVDFEKQWNEFDGSGNLELGSGQSGRDIPPDHFLTLADDIKAELDGMGLMTSFLEEEGSSSKKCGTDPYRYIVSPDHLNWQQAKTYCINLGGNLAFHEMRGSLKRRREILNSLSVGEVWIGANDIEEEGAWKWMDGKTVQRKDMHWNTGEPNNYFNQMNSRGSEDCAAISKGWRNWRANDKPCEVMTWCLCEIPNLC